MNAALFGLLVRMDVAADRARTALADEDADPRVLLEELLGAWRAASEAACRAEREAVGVGRERPDHDPNRLDAGLRPW
jgi:hypothetical protein